MSPSCDAKFEFLYQGEILRKFPTLKQIFPVWRKSFFCFFFRGSGNDKVFLLNFPTVLVFESFLLLPLNVPENVKLFYDRGKTVQVEKWLMTQW